MLYFNPKPNYERLSRHYQLQGTSEQMKEWYTDGFPIVIDRYYTDEMVAAIETGFKAITDQYDLTDNHEDLLFLLLLKYQEIGELDYEMSLLFEQQKRLKELAKLLLYFKEVPEAKFKKLSVSSHLNAVNVNDSRLISWIGKLLIEAIESGNYPISLFSIVPEALFKDESDKHVLDIDTLRSVSEATVTSPLGSYKETIADFCLSVYKYLVDETNIRPNVQTLFSNKALSFFFEVLELFNLIRSEDIESEPVDYMRTLLKNRIKTLNT